MSIELRKLVKSSEFTRTCEQIGCNRVGRYALSMIGLPVWTEHPIATRREQAQVCRPCAKEVQALWDELTGKTHEEKTLQSLHALAGSPSERFEAVDALRELGYSAEQVARAVKETKDGSGAERILEVLGADERVGVAA
jgi:RuvA, C-terminal domain